MSSNPWFVCNLRVRYQETDQMGVVYHANYLNWFELGRTEFIREMGVPYKNLEEKNLLLPVVDAELHFKQPARYDDVVKIYVKVNKFSSFRIKFEIQIRRSAGLKEVHMNRGMLQNHESPIGQLLVEGNTQHVWINKEWKPVRLDREAPEVYHILMNLKRE